MHLGDDTNDINVRVGLAVVEFLKGNKVKLNGWDRIIFATLIRNNLSAVVKNNLVVVVQVVELSICWANSSIADEKNLPELNERPESVHVEVECDSPDLTRAINKIKRAELATRTSIVPCCGVTLLCASHSNGEFFVKGSQR